MVINRSVGSIKPHPFNIEIYGTEQADNELVQSVKENGILVPLAITGTGFIISGHRRHSAAVIAGLESVPCVVAKTSDNLSERSAIIEYNRQRKKTPEQIAREYTALKYIEGERAKERMLSGKCIDPPNNSSEGSAGDAREKAAEQLGVSFFTLERTNKIVDAADSGDEDARALLDEVNAGEKSVSGAYNEFTKKAHVANNSGNNEWYTPPRFIESARMVMGSIDLDPASSALANKTVKADLFYSEQENGIDKKWWGNVWMNPPYAQPTVRHFCERFVDAYRTGEINQGIILVNNATETQYIQAMLDSVCAICFPASRIKFIDMDGNPSGAPLQGQMFLYFGNHADSFVEEFSQYGFSTVIG